MYRICEPLCPVAKGRILTLTGMGTLVYARVGNHGVASCPISPGAVSVTQQNPFTTGVACRSIQMAKLQASPQAQNTAGFLDVPRDCSVEPIDHTDLTTENRPYMTSKCFENFHLPKSPGKHLDRTVTELPLGKRRVGRCGRQVPCLRDESRGSPRGNEPFITFLFWRRTFW